MNGAALPRRALAAALARYRDEPIAVRAFVRLRHWLTPLGSILAEVPSEARLLDVGCGHGLASLALALGSPRRQVLGIDPSAAKIAVARHAAGAVSNARGYDAIVVLDVLYLLPPDEKRELLRACRERIAPGGLLLVKTNDTEPRWKFAVTLTQERLMTRIGLTLGGADLHFLGRAENAALLREAGFRVEVRPLPTWLPYPAVLFIARPAR